MRYLLISFLCTLQLACASTVITRAEDPGATRNYHTHHLFFWGWLEASPPVAVNEICGMNNWSKIHTEYNILNIAIGLLTVGIYTPVAVNVYCSGLQSRR